MRIDLSFGTWMATLVVGAAVLAALAVGAVLLRRRQGSRLANASLGGLLVVAALAVFYAALLVVQPPGENLGVVLAPLPFTLSLGPLLYTYVRARLGLGAPHWTHAVLPVIQALVLLTVGLGPMSWKAWYAATVFFPWWGMTQVALVAVSLVAYLVLSTRVLRASSAPFAWAARRDRWLSALLAGIVVSAVMLVVVDVVVPLAIGAGRLPWATLSMSLYAVMLLLAVRVGLVQADLLPPPSAPSAPLPASRAASGAVAPVDAALPPDVIAAHAAALTTLVETEKPYLDPDLTLGSLAAQIGLTDKTLSAVLNATGAGYADTVNGLRVDEAQRRLRDPAHAHLSVLAVGLDSGFASKSTFNRVFKERTGETPSAYRASGGV